MTYPIGTAGQPWGAAEREQWRSLQTIKRRYAVDVLTSIDRLRSRFDVEQYGELDYASDRYPLLAIKTRNWRDELPIALVTGGVHGYETSGVHGALQFVDGRELGVRNQHRAIELFVTSGDVDGAV